MKIAQTDPWILFDFDIPVTLKANKRYVFIIDTDKMTLSIESYYWFVFKNWIKKIFKK
jgi:hypothetical protein